MSFSWVFIRSFLFKPLDSHSTFSKLEAANFFIFSNFYKTPKFAAVCHYYDTFYDILQSIGIKMIFHGMLRVNLNFHFIKTILIYKWNTMSKIYNKGSNLHQKLYVEFKFATKIYHRDSDLQQKFIIEIQTCDNNL